jgi:hypothetical protein
VRDARGRFVGKGGEGARVVDRDTGYRELMNLVFNLAREKPKIAVGVFESEGGLSAGKGTTVVDIAIWNEFGTADIPARSFLRGWFDENEETAKTALMRFLQGYLEKKYQTKEQALDAFGAWLQGQIQARIAKGIPPPNAPSTIAKKGSSKPLIDSGQLRSSITFAVSLNGAELTPKRS